MDDGSCPILPVEDDHPALVGYGRQFVVLVGDVLQGVNCSLVENGVVVPEGLGVGQWHGIVIPDTEQLSFHVDCIPTYIP